MTRDERDRLERDVTATMATLLLRVGVDAAAARHHRKPPEVLIRPGANLSTGQQVIELLTHFKVNELLPKGVLKAPVSFATSMVEAKVKKMYVAGLNTFCLIRLLEIKAGFFVL